MKICQVCKTEKPLTEFGNNKSNKDGKMYQCRICCSNKAKSYYHSHSKAQMERVKANVEKIRVWFQGVKSTLSCIKCGESHPACLDFHHKDPSQKSFNIGRSFRSGSRKRILKEIDKCDVLCSNCHRKLHYPSVAQ